jgi:hypothetical protein
MKLADPKQQKIISDIISLREKGVSFEKILQFSGYRKLGRKIILPKKTA